MWRLPWLLETTSYGAARGPLRLWELCGCHKAAVTDPVKRINRLLRTELSFEMYVGFFSVRDDD